MTKTKAKMLWALPPPNRGIFTEMTEVTPTIAEMMLQHNIFNNEKAPLPMRILSIENGRYTVEEVKE